MSAASSTIDDEVVGNADQPVTQGGVLAVLVATFESTDDGVLDGVGRKVGIVGDPEGVAVERVEMLVQFLG